MGKPRSMKAGKNKGTNQKGNFEALANTCVEQVKALTEQVGKLAGMVKEVVDGHNILNEALQGLQKNQQGIATFAAQEIGKTQAMHQQSILQVMESLDHMDLNVLATAEILKEMFGRFEIVDKNLESAKTADGQGIAIPDIDQAGLEEVRAAALENFDSSVTAAFDRVRKRIELEKAKQEEERAAALKAKEAAEKEAADKGEAARVEEELRTSEQRGVADPHAGGQGATFPEGAEIFGG